MLKKNLVLIGFMGVGKTSIGRKLAEILEMEFIDTDQEIQRLTNLSVSQIFIRHGETRFRSEEELLIKKLSEKEHLVIATGGGTVLKRKNIEELRKSGILIYLKARPEVIQTRVNKKGGRPLLFGDSSLERIKELLEEREEFYSNADYTLNVDGLNPEEIITLVMDLLQQIGFIDINKKS